MKKLLAILAILAMAVSLNAADLKWDASTGDVDGYNVYFSDGINNYNYNAGAALEVLDIVSTLNLRPGVTYTFTATAYNNELGESGLSNEATYTTDPSYVIPDDSIPVKIQKPSIITIIVE